MAEEQNKETDMKKRMEEVQETMEEMAKTAKAGEAEEAVAAGDCEITEESVAAEESEQPEKKEGDEEKKSLFKKKDKKNKQDEKIAELSDQVKRQMAEFDNFRKRTEKEKAQMFEIGARSIIEKILPVVDNFERGLAAVPQESSEDSFVEGMNKIYKQLLAEMESLEVKPIEAVGKEFDPDFHNAVTQVESEEFESGIVAQELLKGYMYRETVVRHSMVAVVQ